MELVLSMLLGIGLAAAVGFRVFLPFFLLSAAAYFDLTSMASGFSWMDSLPAVLALGTATAIEVGAYFIPWLDNLLDSITIPGAMLGGAAAMATTLGDSSPMFQWGLAIIAGAGTAGTIKGATSSTRLASTATTGGLANPIISAGETISAIFMSVLAMLLGPVAGILAIAILAYAIFRIFRWISRRKATA